MRIFTMRYERKGYMVDVDLVKNIFAKLVDIDSPSLNESCMAFSIKELFENIGVELEEDESGKVTGSTAGNLFGFIKGTDGEAREGNQSILLSAHMDTVNPAKGKRAVFHEDGTVTSDGTTVLGADDLSAVTAIYVAVRYLKEHSISHRPFELLFSTGEELYCKGAKAFDYSKVTSKSALVLDLSGELGGAAFSAPTILSYSVTINGKASHAGFNPDEGINAIKAAAEAISRLPQGQIDPVTTANVGTISGGSGVNIVSDKCVIRGEIRSLKHSKAVELANRYKSVFEQVASTAGASVEWTECVDVQAYETSQGSSIVKEYKEACDFVGIKPKLIKTFGGSDNNVFAQYGIEGLVIANSMNKIHSCEEYTNIYEIAQVADLLIRILSKKTDLI